MKKYLKTILLWLFVAFFASSPHGAVLLVFTIPLILIYLPICLFKLIFKKTTAREVGIKLSIILISHLIIGAVHLIRFEDARSNADRVVAEIHAYKAKHGKYPEKASEINLGERPFSRGKLSYINEVSGPMLFYPATQAPFDTYHYNFEDSKWEYHAD